MTSCLLLASAAAAQERHSGSPFAGTPLFAIVGNGTASSGGSLSTKTIYGKKSGFFAPAAHTLGGASPDFSFEALFRRMDGTIPDIAIDAISFGLDYVYVDEMGHTAIPTDRWAALLLSVGKNTNGEPGSTIRREAADPDGAGADVFSFVLDGSQFIASDLIGKTERAIGNDELDLIGTTTDKPEIEALDGLAWMYELDASVRNLLPGIATGTTLTVYFSVKNASVTNVPDPWWGPPPNRTFNKSGATILMRTWDSSTNTWNQVQPFLTWNDLELKKNDDVDALAVSDAQNALLFSTTDVTQTQLKFASGWTDDDLTTGDYLDPTGSVAVAGQAGVGTNGNVDGACLPDPGTAFAQFGPTALAFSTLRPPQFPFDTWPLRLSCSMFRTCDTSGNPMMHSMMVGWGPGGRTVPTPPSPIGAFLLTFEGQNPMGTWDRLPMFFPFTVPRNPLNPFGGDPVEVVLGPLPTPAMSGRRLVGQWLMIDGAKTAPPFFVSHEMIMAF